MSYEIVTFYVDLARTSAPPVGDTAVPQRGTERALLDLMFRSVQARAGAAGFTILSDRRTDFSAAGMNARIVRHDIDTEKLMFERTRVQAEFIGTFAFDRPTVFLDTDILVTRSLEEVFSADFDIGLTWRRHQNMPFNGGVIFANNKRPEQVIRFFNTLLDVYKADFSGQASWFGDQQALAKLLDIGKLDADVPEFIERHGIVFRLLPCDRFNYSPRLRRFMSMDFLLGARNRHIMHFKGRVRKRYMEPLFRALFDTNASWRRRIAAVGELIQLPYKDR